MISTMGEDFVLTARAKGLSERRISTVHVAGNAIIPITARMSLEFAAIMSGSVFFDRILSNPGIGYYFIFCVTNEDYPLIEAATFMLRIITIIGYLFGD